MRVGTKSVLFGAHCFFIHPFFVAFGWWALGRFPWDPRLWAAFFLHDLGYLFSPNMDGLEGEEHVHLGAKIMGLLFGHWWADFYKLCGICRKFKRFFRERGMGCGAMAQPELLKKH